MIPGAMVAHGLKVLVVLLAMPPEVAMPFTRTGVPAHVERCVQHGRGYASIVKARVDMATLPLLLGRLPTFPARTAPSHSDSGGGQAGMIVAAPRGRHRPLWHAPTPRAGGGGNGHLNEREKAAGTWRAPPPGRSIPRHATTDHTARSAGPRLRIRRLSRPAGSDHRARRGRRRLPGGHAHRRRASPCATRSPPCSATASRSSSPPSSR